MSYLVSGVHVRSISDRFPRRRRGCGLAAAAAAGEILIIIVLVCDA